MKRFLSVLLALAMVASMTTVAFAKGGKKPTSGHYSGIADFKENEVEPGDTVELDVDYFYGKWTETVEEWDSKREKDVKVKVTVDSEDEPIGYLEKEYHKVSATWNSGGNYVQSVYFEDGDSYVSIELKGDASTVDREISGTIRIKESGIPNRPDVTYECKIQKGTLILKGIDEKSRMVWIDDKKFGLPDDYQKKQVRFATENDGSYGTFIGEFWSEKSNYALAEFKVKIIDQKSLYLGLSEAENKTIAKAYPNADLRFINWTARPTFDYSGTLSIYMDPDEYIYGINDDNQLYRLGGTYDSDNDAYVISTKTLGSYVISDVQLTAASSGSGTTTTTPSSSTAPSSSAAPSSTAPSSTAPPPSSSVAPQPSSSVAPPPSSSEESSSEPEEDPSEPEIEEPEDPDDEEPSDPDDKDDDDGDKEDEKTSKKKFPLVPLLFGILGIVVLVCAVVVVGNRNSGSHSRSRRRRYDDDWDD